MNNDGDDFISSMNVREVCFIIDPKFHIPFKPIIPIFDCIKGPVCGI